MEDSSLNSMRGSSRGKTLIDHHEVEVAEEESGWTTYLGDFSGHRSLSYTEQNGGFCSSFSTGTSLVSDAASRYHDQANLGLRSPPNCFNHSTGRPKKLSLIKKIRTKKTGYEDPLEDTASSPASSPKVDEHRRVDMISGKADDNVGPVFFGSGSEEKTTDGRDDQTGFQGQNRDSSASLKNKGLCLVTLSLFANYLG